MLCCLHFVSTYLLVLRFEVSGLKFCVYKSCSFECPIASHNVSTVLHCMLNLLVAYLFVFDAFVGSVLYFGRITQLHL